MTDRIPISEFPPHVQDLGDVLHDLDDRDLAHPIRPGRERFIDTAALITRLMAGKGYAIIKVNDEEDDTPIPPGHVLEIKSGPATGSYAVIHHPGCRSSADEDWSRCPIRYAVQVNPHAFEPGRYPIVGMTKDKALIIDDPRVESKINTGRLSRSHPADQHMPYGPAWVDDDPPEYVPQHLKTED